MKPNIQKTIYLCAAAFVLSLLYSLTSAAGLALIPIILVCACAGAYTVAKLISPTKLTFLAPIGGAVCAFFISMNVSAAISACIPFVCGAAIALCVTKKAKKTSAVLVCDCVMGALALLSLAVAYYISKGTLSPSAIADDVKSVFAQAENTLIETMRSIGFYDIFAKIYDVSDYTEESFISEIAKEAIFFAKVISPAVIITALNIISYACVRLFELAAKISKTEIAVPERWFIMPSAATCYVMLGSLIFYAVSSLLSSSDVGTAVGYAALNLVIILIPPLGVCGLRGLIGKLKSEAYHRGAVVILVICIVAFLINAVYGLIFISLEGVWDMIAYYRTKKYYEDQNQ
ncbi:MAG: hypothetical protein KBS59_04495 [Clostridiales bacterium]|nr:hypothetical protein [Clostridiales bacterium]